MRETNEPSLNDPREEKYEHDIDRAHEMAHAGDHLRTDAALSRSTARR